MFASADRSRIRFEPASHFRYGNALRCCRQRLYAGLRRGRKDECIEAGVFARNRSQPHLASNRSDVHVQYQFDWFAGLKTGLG